MEKSAESTGNQLRTRHGVLRWVFKFNAWGKTGAIGIFKRCLRTLLLALGIWGSILVPKLNNQSLGNLEKRVLGPCSGLRETFYQDSAGSKEKGRRHGSGME